MASREINELNATTLFMQMNNVLVYLILFCAWFNKVGRVEKSP